MSSEFLSDSQSLAMRARILARRKAKLNVCFREECEDQNVSSEMKQALEIKFHSFVAEHITNTTELSTTSGGHDLARAFAADRRSWEEFKIKNFPTKCTTNKIISFESILKPPPGQSQNPKAQVLHVTHTHPHNNTYSEPLTTSKRLHLRLNITKNQSVFARKPGWKKESEYSLLKGVLVSNASRVESFIAGDMSGKESMNSRLIYPAFA
ncbi:hypothetical protein F5050DRAFT_1786792 [Lentinula boryana]|uniref:Uncharacterized protein n=1 Tax=Lentinula boryana TaxID=40481 RepID=A0ABQ8Q4K1_9AGAR|nr:hypothetical protein F5050DRAFT_1786792 [Lentinula boryana]